MKKVFEPVLDIVEDVSEVITETVTETSEDNNKPLASLNDKLSEILNHRVIIQSFLLSPLFEMFRNSSYVTNSEHTSRIKLLKEPVSNRIGDHLVNKQKQVLYITIC